MRRTRHLFPGAAGWLLATTLSLLGIAAVGLRPDLHGARRGRMVALVLAGCALPITLAREAPGAWDLSEMARNSLPPAAARGLAELPGKLRVTAHLDREDSRRSQLESDTLAKLRLARPDLTVRWPLDDAGSPGSFDQDERYGQLLIALGDRQVTTTSTSRREIITLIFSLADRPLPDWSRIEYPGYPLVLAGTRRSVALALAYVVSPAALLLLGFALTTHRRRTHETSTSRNSFLN